MNEGVCQEEDQGKSSPECICINKLPTTVPSRASVSLLLKRKRVPALGGGPQEDAVQ